MRVSADRPLRLDMESLRIFVAVIEEGSIAAAATRTHIVASAVSKRISDLEDDAGTPLLYRHSRGVQLTPAGEALYHHAKRLGEHLQQISDELEDDVISMPHGTSISKLCRTAAERDGRRRRVRIEVTNFEGVRNMVSAGVGNGVLPKGSVAPYMHSAPFRVVELDEPWSLRPLLIIARNFDTLPLPARRLVDHLDKHRIACDYFHLLLEIAQGTLYLKTVFSQLLRAPRTNQERDIGARFDQSGAIVATDGAGA
jgi:DNA-binding transcriptional LysR family regulator